MSVRCRTCGEQTNNQNAKNIFEKSNSSILHKIEALTGIWLSDEPNMPEHICAYCLLDLNHAMLFRRRCINTHKNLLQGSFKMPAKNNGLVFLKREKKEHLLTPKIENTDLLDPLNDSELARIDSDGTISDEDSVKSIEPVLNLEEEDRPDSQSSLNYEINNSSDQSADKPTPKRKYIKWCDLTEEEIKELKRKRRTRDHVCDQCGKHFTDTTNFKLHMLRHSGVKEYTCPECDHKDYTSHLLNMHIRTRHKGELPYACRYCDERFHRSTIRCRHERRMHTKQTGDKRTFICETCNKAYFNKHSLRNHQRAHTGERPYHCKTCNLAFLSQSNLNTHYRSKYHKNKKANEEHVKNRNEIDPVIEKELNQK